jgi:hypothetical protein
MDQDLPSAFSMTLALFPSMTATQELVVPRSIPMILEAGLSSLALTMQSSSEKKRWVWRLVSLKVS